MKPFTVWKDNQGIKRAVKCGCSFPRRKKIKFFLEEVGRRGAVLIGNRKRKRCKHCCLFPWYTTRRAKEIKVEEVEWQFNKNKRQAEEIAIMKTQKEIEKEIRETEGKHRGILTGSLATIDINAPRALQQLAIQSKLHALYWTVGTAYKSKLKGVNK